MFPFLNGIDRRLSLPKSLPLPELTNSGLNDGLVVATVHRSFLFENHDLLPNVSGATLEALRAVGASYEQRSLALRLFRELPDASAGDLSQHMAVHAASAMESTRELSWLREATRLGRGEARNGVWSARTATDQLHQIVGWLVIADKWKMAAKLLPSMQMALRVTEWPDPVSSAISLFGEQNIHWEFDKRGPDHDQEFTCRLSIVGKTPMEGLGKSKKQARANVALEALQTYASKEQRSSTRNRREGNTPIHGPKSPQHSNLLHVSEVIDVDETMLFLVEQALTHSSWTYENRGIVGKYGQRDNARLAWLGSHTLNLDTASESALVALRGALEEFSFRTSEANHLASAAEVCDLPSMMFLGRGQSGSVTSQMAADVFQSVHAVKALSDPAKSPFGTAEGQWEVAREIVAPNAIRGVDEKTDLQEVAVALSLDVEYTDEVRGSDHQRETRSIVSLASSELGKGLRVGGPWCRNRTRSQRAAAARVLSLLEPLRNPLTVTDVEPLSGQGKLLAFILSHVQASPVPGTRAMTRWLHKGLFGLKAPVTPSNVAEGLLHWQEACKHLEAPFLNDDSLDEFVYTTFVRLPEPSSLDDLISNEASDLTQACAEESDIALPYTEHIELVAGCANLLRIRSIIGEPQRVQSDLDDLALLLRGEVVEPGDRRAIPESAVWEAGSREALSFILRHVQNRRSVEVTSEITNASGGSLTVQLDNSDYESVLSLFAPMLAELQPSLAIERSEETTEITFGFLDANAPRSIKSRVWMAWRERLLAMDTRAAETLHGVKNSLSAAQALAERPTTTRRESLETELSIRENLDEVLRLLTELKWKTSLSNSDLTGQCDLAAEASSFIAAVRPRIGDMVNLQSTIPGSALVIPMLNVELQLILANIFKNAHEAIGGEGSITVDVTKEGDYAHLEMQDSGDGFTETVSRDLSTPPADSTKSGGSGIGLSTVRRIVNRAGGFIDIDSSDSGTRVKIAFPIVGQASGEALP